MTGGHQQGGHGISLGAGEGVCFSGSGDGGKEEGDSSGVHKGKARAVQIWIPIPGTTLTCCVTVGNSSTSLSLVSSCNGEPVEAITETRLPVS